MVVENPAPCSKELEFRILSTNGSAWARFQPAFAPVRASSEATTSAPNVFVMPAGVKALGPPVYDATGGVAGSEPRVVDGADIHDRELYTLQNAVMAYSDHNEFGLVGDGEVIYLYRSVDGDTSPDILDGFELQVLIEGIVEAQIVL